MDGPREWDAASYDEVAAPMTNRGVVAVGRLELSGDETVLDAGCGTGRVTEHLLSLLPRGRVLALDASRRMLDVAARRLGHDPRVAFVHADLGKPLPLEEPVDAIVSTSTLHWVPDHDALWAHLAEALRPGGRLVVDCGGAGNIADVLAALRALGETFDPWTYAAPDETLARLDAAGFTDLRVWMSRDPAVIDPDELEHYLATVVLGAHLDRLDPDAGAALVHGVARQLDEPVIDYIRLNVVARRAPAG